MVKHLFFDSSSFENCCLSAVLKTILQQDLQAHSGQQGQTLRFMQGKNEIIRTEKGIVVFVNQLCGLRLFGRNSQQQSLIHSVSGVCVDVSKSLSNEKLEESKIKLSYLNNFWNTPENQWLNERMCFAHIVAFQISFHVQKLSPQTYCKYECFNTIRRQMLEQFACSQEINKVLKQSEFASYDLYPKSQGSQQEDSGLKESEKMVTLPESEVSQSQLVQQKQDQKPEPQDSVAANEPLTEEIATDQQQIGREGNLQQNPSKEEESPMTVEVSKSANKSKESEAPVVQKNQSLAFNRQTIDMEKASTIEQPQQPHQEEKLKSQKPHETQKPSEQQQKGTQQKQKETPATLPENNSSNTAAKEQINKSEVQSSPQEQKVETKADEEVVAQRTQSPTAQKTSSKPAVERQTIRRSMETSGNKPKEQKASVDKENCKCEIF